MKIIRLSAHNIKRLTAVEITPEGTLIKIGGKNGAGKSSVLDAIAYALGGQALVPAEPIHTGESEANIVVDLGDIIVTRRFKRERYDATVGGQGTEDIPPTFGETTSTLMVTNKEGARYPSPQAMLDKLLGKLTFDPLQFSRATPRDQNDILRRMLKLDTAPLDQQRTELLGNRAMLKKNLSSLEVRLSQMPQYPDAPTVEISLKEVSDELMRANELRTVAETVMNQRMDLETKARALSNNVDNIERELTRLDDLVRLQKEQLRTAVNQEEAALKQLEILKEQEAAAHQQIPDVTQVQTRLAEIEQTNRLVRENAKRADVIAEWEKFNALIAERTVELDKIEKAKRDALASVHYPIDGLGLDDHGVTFQGLPFEQASAAEQLRVSVAIGLALNPGLKVLLVKNGNQLDSHSLELLGSMAEAADTQVWMEWVAESKDGMSVMIEDGAVV